ncbi:MAG TPA: hypothetical protein VIN61_04800 [Gammaproteobacteria bacterium]
MGFFLWLEQTWLAEWVRSSTTGYPTMITSHAIGMAVMVGLAVLLALRVLGVFRELPLPALQRYLGLAWAGFGLNFLSGVGLFVAQATMYVTDATFLIKIALVFLGAAATGALQGQLAKEGGATNPAPSGGMRATAALSIVFWIGAIITGRLIAYV